MEENKVITFIFSISFLQTNWFIIHRFWSLYSLRIRKLSQIIRYNIYKIMKMNHPNNWIMLIHKTRYNNRFNKIGSNNSYYNSNSNNKDHVFNNNN